MDRQMPAVADRVYEFHEAAEFVVRPRYIRELRIAPDQLGQIIGKYTLPADESSYISCGLNGCIQRHRFGYLLNNISGDETNCGQHCGEREFGVKFKDVEALFEQRLDAQARERALQNLIAERASLFAECSRLLPIAMAAAARMQDFRKDFQSKTSFWNQLQNVARAAGDIRTASDEHARGGSGKNSLTLTSIGRIDGAEILLSSNDNSHHRAIIHRIQPWLRDELNPNKVDTLDQKSIGIILIKAGDVRTELAACARFCDQATRFLEPSNLRNLELIRTRLMSQGAASGALVRVVKRWAGGQ